MTTTLIYLMSFAAVILVPSSYGKPVTGDQVVKSFLRDGVSQTLKEKAEAIDNLLRLLSEVNLPSICDAIAAQKKGGDEQASTVDAILAEAARSQAMTLIPTNLPETPAVTRPGNAPINFAGKGSARHLDGKQASQELAISRSEGKMGRLSLDIAAALTAKKQLKRKNYMKNPNVHIPVSNRGGRRRHFPRRRFPKRRSTPTPTSQATTPTSKISTATTIKSMKNDPTIPTLTSDMMLHDGIFESGDGENTIDGFTTEQYTTLRMEDEGEKIFRNPFDNKLKNIFQDQDQKTLDLQKNLQTNGKIQVLTKSTTFENAPASLYKTVVPSMKGEMQLDYTESEIVPTVQDDFEWGFTIPTNTTFGEFMFGNITLNDNLSEELASILNSTMPLDFLISNDTLYNEFMAMINDTLAHEESKKQDQSFDMTLNESGDYQNLMDYISNITEKLSTTSPEVNISDISDSLSNPTTVLDLNLNNTDDSFNIQIVETEPNSTSYSTYSIKVNKVSGKSSPTLKSDHENRVTDPANFEYVDSKFPKYPPRREDMEEFSTQEDELKDHTIFQKADFVAGDYYAPVKSEDVNMIAGSNNLVAEDYVTSKFKHSGFAPLNHNKKYKINAKNSGLTYLGFDFKHVQRSPYTPKMEDSNMANEVAALTNQKTIWSEPSEPTTRQVTYPTGYTCPGLFGYYGDAHDCKSFFICSWGVPYRFHCPHGTTWSSEESVCNWTRNVECQQSK